MNNKNTKYFIDTEFIEDGKTIDLISIGIVCEDSREYYAINEDCDFDKANQWVKDNVLPSLPDRAGSKLWKPKNIIRSEVVQFCKNSPEFWGYYSSYDWVVFCQLFGTMIDLPKGLPMYCNDIKQECCRAGNPKLPIQGKGEHDALEDARWNKKAWEFLQDTELSMIDRDTFKRFDDEMKFKRFDDELREKVLMAISNPNTGRIQELIQRGEKLLLSCKERKDEDAKAVEIKVVEWLINCEVVFSATARNLLSQETIGFYRQIYARNLESHIEFWMAILRVIAENHKLGILGASADFLL